MKLSDVVGSRTGSVIGSEQVHEKAVDAGSEIEDVPSRKKGDIDNVALESDRPSAA